MRNSLLTSCLLIAGCSMNSSIERAAGPIMANPSSIAANPAAYDGKLVEITGMIVWDGAQGGLHQSYGTYCRGAEKSSIAVDWARWPGVQKADNRRQVTVRGIFRNRTVIQRHEDAVFLISSSAGPGPLEPGGVVQWLSPAEKPCPKALP